MALIRRVEAFWLSLTLAALAAALRLVDLGNPHAVVFDETYYVKDAWGLMKSGYELQTVKGADQLLLNGNTNILTNQAEYIVHPPMGKYIIGIGETLVGMNPFGWRIMPAILGILAVVMVHRIARRLFRHELTAFLAGLFMAIDGMAIVHSRTALLDNTLMFFTVLSFGAVVLDRDWVDRRLSAGAMRAGWRPWLVVAAIGCGLTTATKWSGLWITVGCALLVLVFSARIRIRLGHSLPWVRAILHDTLPWVPVIAVIVVGTYAATWAGWFASTDAWDRQWAIANPTLGIQWLPASVRSLVHYHQEMWNFHVNLRSKHNYSANPWTWPLNLRPTSFYYEGYKSGTNGCTYGDCSVEVVALGNPLIWWAGTAAVLHQAWRFITRREARAFAIVLMFVVAWAPWLMYQQRTVFGFYAIEMLPFMCLALAGSIGTFLGGALEGRDRALRAAAAGVFVVATIGLSLFFYPLWTGQMISFHYWQMHMWLATWV